MTFQPTNIAHSEGIYLEAEAYVFDLFKKRANARLVFHNFKCTHQLVQLIEVIATEIQSSNQAKELAKLASLFCFTGYLTNYANAKAVSVQEAERFLLSNKYSKAKTEKIKDLIRLAHTAYPPTTEEQELFNDAFYALYFGDAFLSKRPLLQLEKELVQQQIMSKQQWTSLQLQQLLNVKFYTNYGKKQFEPIVAQNIFQTKKQLNKYNKGTNPVIETPKTLSVFEELEGEIPNRAIQTYFRANYRTHINLSAIADNKANIMISVNAILLSVLISLLTYKNITETNPMVLMAVIIFFITGLTSLVFAVLSARPKITTINKRVTDIHITKKNLIFFGNFVHLDLEQYEEAIDAMFRSDSLIYGNMVRDIYFLGKVLDKKYRYLTNSYNIFMVGFIATAITFLVALLLP